VTTPIDIVLTLSSTGRPVVTHRRVGSIEPTLPWTQQRADERTWKVSDNGVVFFKPQRRSRWAARARHWGVALLVIATTLALVLLTLVVAYATQ
jgi:hypothetical protein